MMNKSSSMKVFLDMDGVLVDFVKAVETIYYPFKVDCWDFDNKLVREDGSTVSRTEFWASCNEKFWDSLDWTEDGQEILMLLESKFGESNICLLTSPCLTYGCREGKWSWIRRNLAKYWRNNLMGSAKGFLAAPGKLLVDDHDGNVDSFLYDADGNPTGGEAILVPRIWNRNAHHQTLPYIREALKKYPGISKSIFVGG